MLIGYFALRFPRARPCTRYTFYLVTCRIVGARLQGSKEFFSIPEARPIDVFYMSQVQMAKQKAQHKYSQAGYGTPATGPCRSGLCGPKYWPRHGTLGPFLCRASPKNRTRPTGWASLRSII
jgi:hypothetical protein